MRPHHLISFIVLSGLLTGTVCSAETVYIVTDEDGNITYLDHPPEAGAGQVETRTIDPDANVVPFGETDIPGLSSGSTTGSSTSPDSTARDDSGDDVAAIDEEGAFAPAPDPVPADTTPSGTEAPGASTPPSAPTAPPPAAAPAAAPAAGGAF